MILVLCAHPDDESLGLGATLAGLKGDKVGFCLTSQSAFVHILPEMLNAYKVLGLKYLHDWDQNFKHREFNRQQVLDTFIKLRDYLKPDIVYTHSSFDCHNDHKVVHEETVRAFKHSTILGYDLPWNNVKGSDFRYYNNIEPSAVNIKLEALKCYKSQEHRTYFDREYQRAQMICNGQQKNVFYAERFEVISYVNHYNSR